MDELKIFLDFCKKQDIHVISFLPPFADEVYEAMLKSGNHDYIGKVYDALKPIYKQYQFELYNYSKMAYFNSDDSEVHDGWHGGEVAYLRILMDMLEKGSQLNKYTNLERPREDFKNRIHRYAAYPN